MFHCVLFCSRSAVGLFCSVPACSLTELVSRLNAALINVQDLPAAIRRRSFASSSNVQRILAICAPSSLSLHFSLQLRNRFGNAPCRLSCAPIFYEVRFSFGLLRAPPPALPAVSVAFVTAGTSA